MTTFTKADLATRILRDAGLIGAEETPSAIDLLFAEETLSSEIDLMAAKGIKIWDGDEISVPNGYLTVLSRRIGLALGPAFGLGSFVEASTAINALERDLRTLSAIPATGETIKVESF
jgi:hypothetical protein